MICGLAETVACILFGFLMTVMSDSKTAILMNACCLIFNIIYRLLGAGNGGALSILALFIAILGVGGLGNSTYLLIEMRVAPESQGAAMIIM